ncbi:hypothetical protein Tco_1437281 [Tanacetum coccineum]
MCPRQISASITSGIPSVPLLALSVEVNIAMDLSLAVVASPRMKAVVAIIISSMVFGTCSLRRFVNSGLLTPCMTAEIRITSGLPSLRPFSTLIVHDLPMYAKKAALRSFSVPPVPPLGNFLRDPLLGPPVPS